MKYKHKCSGEVFELSEPNYGKHWFSIYGYLIANEVGIFFIYRSEGDSIDFEDVTNDYEKIK